METNQKTPTGRLKDALKRGDFFGALKALDEGAPAGTTDGHGLTIVHLATKGELRGDRWDRTPPLSSLFLLAQRKVPLDMKGKGGVPTPLAMAVEIGDADAVAALLLLGVQPTYGPTLKTCHLAMSLSRVGTKLLSPAALCANALLQDATPDALAWKEKNSDLTLAMLACRQKNLDLLTGLIRRGAPVAGADKEGNTVFHHLLSPISEKRGTEFMDIGLDGLQFAISTLIEAGATSTPNCKGVWADEIHVPLGLEYSQSVLPQLKAARLSSALPTDDATSNQRMRL